MSETVLDFTKKREENIEKKRRSFDRVVFRNFLGAYSVINDNGAIFPIELVDISKTGCLFQVPWNVKNDTKFKSGHEVSMRMYFTEKSYIPVVCKVKYDKEFLDDQGQTYLQYGCEFDESLPSFQALKSFIDFTYSFAEHSSIDQGDLKSFFL